MGGGNTEAARLSGINVKTVKMTAFMLCSVPGFLAGMIILSIDEYYQWIIKGAVLVAAVAFYGLKIMQVHKKRKLIWNEYERNAEESRRVK